MSVITNENREANRVRDALRAERDVLRASGNDAAANAIMELLFEADDAQMIRFKEIILGADGKTQALKRIANATDDVSGGARFVQIAKDALEP